MKSLNFLLIFTFLVAASCKSQEKLIVLPADHFASSATVKLLANMKALSSKGIMIGHQDDLAYGIGWKAPKDQSDVYKICGDYPAVFGWDLGGIENESLVNLDSVPFADMKKYALEAYSKGGINTFSWHLNNPLTGSNAWDVSQNDVVKSILPGGGKHEVYTSWLDRVAAFLSSLKDEKGEPIPVIFRPFHEQTGGWFWWGRAHCTADEFSHLWKFTFTYLTETKKLHNLIFAFSTGGDFTSTLEFANRYPGDKFVDIVGFDLYQNAGQSNVEFTKLLTNRLNILLDFAKKKQKLAAITELGYEQIPAAEWWTKTFYPAVEGQSVSYALFWRNAANRPNHYYVPYPGQISENDFRKLYDLQGTLFLKDLEKIHIYK
jgi:hypothetical protein